MIKILALMGKAGSGKDTLMRELIKIYPNFKEMISCTTRPPREGEVDGINYYFLNDSEFHNRIASGDMFEYTEFNGWYYGSSVNNLHEDCWHIGVFNPDGIRQLKKLNNTEVIVIYIDANDKERMLRQLNREENPDVAEIARRFNADEEDFVNISNLWDYLVYNDKWPAEQTVKHIWSWLQPIMAGLNAKVAYLNNVATTN